MKFAKRRKPRPYIAEVVTAEPITAPLRRPRPVAVKGHYILNDRVPIPCIDLFTWADWMGRAPHHVGDDTINGVRISTVFLGIDYNFTGKGGPILFETMVFGGRFDEAQIRTPTWEEAEAAHKGMVALVRAAQREGE